MAGERHNRTANVGTLLLAFTSSIVARSSAQNTAAAPVARCESLLVSQQDAASARNRQYFLELRGSNGSPLTYFGVRHTYDPADTQFVSMQREFAALKPTILFYEGTGTQVGANADEAIRKDGEPGLARFLASAAGIPARSLEPSRADEVAALLASFSADDLVMFYTLRPLTELRTRMNATRPTLDSALVRQLAYMHRFPGLQNALPDTAALRSAFTAKFPGVDMMALPPDWFNPTLSSARTAKSLFNSINYASSMFRDVYMYRQLAAAALTPGARVFAEVGRDHIGAQGGALRCAVGAGG
jgi:hypothetical protein